MGESSILKDHERLAIRARAAHGTTPEIDREAANIREQRAEQTRRLMDQINARKAQTTDPLSDQINANVARSLPKVK